MTMVLKTCWLVAARSFACRCDSAISSSSVPPSRRFFKKKHNPSAHGRRRKAEPHGCVSADDLFFFPMLPRGPLRRPPSACSGIRKKNRCVQKKSSDELGVSHAKRLKSCYELNTPMLSFDTGMNMIAIYNSILYISIILYIISFYI